MRAKFQQAIDKIGILSVKQGIDDLFPTVRAVDGSVFALVVPCVSEIRGTSSTVGISLPSLVLI